MNGLAAPIGSLLGRIISPTASSLAPCRLRPPSGRRRAG